MANDAGAPASVGELIDDGKMRGVKVVAVSFGVFFLGAALIYTGLHNYNLFSRYLPSDQKIFAWIPVLLLEGSIIAMTIGSFVWFGFGLQKILATVFGWSLFVLAAVNTLIDSLYSSSAQPPDWLAGYATFFVPVLPVVIAAMWKVLFDVDPAKRERDYKMALAGAISEAKHQAKIKALRGGMNVEALAQYGELFDAALAAEIIKSAPVIDGTAREVKQAPAAESWTDVLKRMVAGLGGGGKPETVVMANDNNGAGPSVTDGAGQAPETVTDDSNANDKKTDSKKDKEGPKSGRTTK